MSLQRNRVEDPGPDHLKKEWFLVYSGFYTGKLSPSGKNYQYTEICNVYSVINPGLIQLREGLLVSKRKIF